MKTGLSFQCVRAGIFILFITFTLTLKAYSETIGVFFDASVPQDSFAAADVKTALEQKGFTTDMQPLLDLNSSYPNKKVIVALASNTAITSLLSAQGGSVPTGLGEQAYALRTTEMPQLSYWALGGDVNGAMYGGLQIAENIKAYGFVGVYNNQESPAVLKRGIKLNLPWDKRSGTYGKTNFQGFEGTSSQVAIPNTWDMNFWTTWFDEMARNRYNTLSLWSMHPFTSLVKVSGYEDCALNGVQNFDGSITPMTIDEKILFFKKMTAYAHSRGFEVILFTWNTFTYGATGKHGIGNDISTATFNYMKASMKKFLETYPDIDGFGMTNGEGTSSMTFLFGTYGDAIYEHALANPTRKLRLICRGFLTTISEIATKSAKLRGLPNVTVDCSLKWSSGHQHSTATPTYETANISTIRSKGLKTWLTIRNDDFFYLHWGDPDYARAYIKYANAQLGPTLVGFYMGGDGYSPTRTFFSKNPAIQGGLEVQRHWYFYKLWGRLSYNPNTPDDVFQNSMMTKFPSVSSQDLFTAWKKGSRGPQLMTELLAGTWYYDRHWWPEGQNALDGGFRTIGNMASCKVANGSNLCSIANTGLNQCGSKITAYQVADSIQKGATEALALISTMSATPNTELASNLNDIKAISYLGLYFAEKIRGATYNKAGKKTDAKTAMGKAYCNWSAYITLMDALFTPMTMQRSSDLLGTNWHAEDADVLKEYTLLGGTGTPSCTPISRFTLATNNINGTVNLNPTGGIYDSGIVVAATAVPNTGRTFLNWSGDATGTANPTNITMNRNKSISAEYSGLSGKNAFAKLEAESFDASSGIQTETTTDLGGGQAVGFINDGDYLVFNNVDFGTGAVSLDARVSSATAGGTLEVRLDGISGNLVGSCTIANTGGWQSWITTNCGISGAVGIHNLYLRFTGGTGSLFNFNWFNFNASTSSTYSLTSIVTNGTITLNPAGGTYASGTPVSVLATPNAGYTFTNWSGALTGSTNPQTVTMNANQSVTANFTPLVTDGNIGILGSWVAGTSRAKEPGANRALVVFVYGEHSSAMSVNTVTFGGQALIPIVSKNQGTGTRSYVGTFILNEVGIDAATSNAIAISWATSPSSGSSVVSVFLSNVNQATLTQAAMAGSTAIGGSDGAASVSTPSLATASGDMVLVAAVAANNGSNYAVNNGFTKGPAEQAPSWGDIVAGYKSGTGASETPTVTAPSSQRQAIVGLVLKK